MTRIFTILAAIALALSYLAMPASAAAGFDSAYAGESAFINLMPNQSGSFQVFFRNTGTATWSKGTATQVDLAACLEDKINCNVQDPQDAGWNLGWMSPGRYTMQVQSAVAAGEIGTFAYNVVAPSNSAGQTHRFNGDLVVDATGVRIHPEGYYQDATVGTPPPPAPTPAPTARPTPVPTPTPTPTPPVLKCFDGTTDTANGETGGAIYGGTCTITGARSAVLNNVPPGRDGAYSGVFLDPDVLKGRTLASVNDLSFSFTGSVLEGNGPRISLPIAGESGTFYAFIDARDCNDGAGNVRVLTDATCTIYWTGGPVSGAANWTAFKAAVGATNIANSTTFIVADGPGAWTISGIALD